MQVTKLEAEVSSLVRSFRDTRKRDASVVNSYALELFSLLEWGKNSSHYRVVDTTDSGCVYLFELGSYDSFLLTVSGAEEERENSSGLSQLTRRTLEHGYNRMIPWVVSTNFDNLRIHNVYWGHSQDGTIFRDLSVEDYWKRLDDLWLISVESFATGLIHDQEQRERPTERKVPVDRNLVEKTDGWRRRLHVSSPAWIGDEAIQRFIHQLFFIRKCEDQKIEPAYLRKVLEARDTSKQLSRVLRYFQATYDTELFSSIVDDWDEFELRRLLPELYDAGFGFRYNFAELPSDILGKIYEAYTSKVAHREVHSDDHGQMLLWPFQDVKFESIQKNFGIYYTPRNLVQFMTEQAFQRLGVSADQLPPKVLDPACGSGGFLIQALESLAVRGFSSPQALLSLRGIDIDHSAATASRLALWLDSVTEPALLPDLSGNILNDDALAEDIFLRPSFEQASFDVILGNPPFRGINDMTSSERIAYAKRFVSAKDRYDLAFLFLEQALKWLRPGGILAMVLPGRFIRNANGAGLRRLLRAEASVELVVDFEDVQLFRGAQSYVSVVILRKQPNVGNTFPLVTVSQVSANTFGLLESVISTSEGAQGITIRDARFGQDALAKIIDFQSEGILECVKDHSQGLRKYARFFQGIRTGADRVFGVELREKARDGWLCQTKSGLVMIEPDLLIPWAKGEHIRRYALAPRQSFLIYPYRDGALIPEDELRSKYPWVYRYLLEHKNELASRSSLNKTQGEWYSYIWPRDQEVQSTGKIIFPDFALAASFAFDSEGTAFTSGSCLLPSKEVEPFALLAFLNSSFASWFIRSHSVPYAGGYVALKASVLHNLPTPGELILRNMGLAAELQDLGQQLIDQHRKAKPDLRRIATIGAKVDDLVFKQFNLSESQRRFLVTSLSESYEAGED